MNSSTVLWEADTTKAIFHLLNIRLKHTEVWPNQSASS